MDDIDMSERVSRPPRPLPARYRAGRRSYKPTTRRRILSEVNV